MQKLNYFISLILLVTILFADCKKSSTAQSSIPCPEADFPIPFLFEILDSGKFIHDMQILSQIKISYDNNGQRLFVPGTQYSDTIKVGENVHQIIGSQFVVTASADQKIKIFYLTYPNPLYKTDTLYLDYNRTPATNCRYTLNSEVLLNNYPLKKNLTYTTLPDPRDTVYIIVKP